MYVFGAFVATFLTSLTGLTGSCVLKGVFVRELLFLSRILEIIGTFFAFEATATVEAIVAAANVAFVPSLKFDLRLSFLSA